MGLTEFLIEHITGLISSAGYIGIGFLMMLESMVAPVPSEAVMPFAGFLWFEGRFNFLSIVLASTLGSIVGSVISYYLGAYGGRAIIRKYGKYLLLNMHHLEMTERFFRKHGEKTIFISRFIPVVRHLISIPAGVGKMNLVKFTIYTIVGAAIWNAFLTWLGYTLGNNWTMIRKYGEIIDVCVIAVILAGIVFLIYRKYARRVRR